jgi:hypothetical protein
MYTIQIQTFLLLNVHSKTGEYQAVKGISYPVKNAKLIGDAFLQEAVSYNPYLSEIALTFSPVELCKQWNDGNRDLW